MKYTVARVISSKPVEGKFGPQFSIFFTTNETGEQGISMFSKYELKPGQEIDGDITQKPGTNKNNEPVTYHNFSFTKKNVSPEKFELEIARVDARLDNLHDGYQTQKERTDKIVKILVEKGLIDAPKQKVTGTDVEYPQSSEGTAFDASDEIRPEDIPFD